MQVAFPTVLENPRKRSVYPNAKSKWESFGVVFLADVRKINVADLIFVVEIYKQIAVTDRDVSHKIAG